MDYFHEMCGLEWISLAERRRRCDLQGLALMSTLPAVTQQPLEAGRNVDE